MEFRPFFVCCLFNVCYFDDSCGLFTCNLFSNSARCTVSMHHACLCHFTWLCMFIFFMTEDQLMIMQFITNLDEKGQTANRKTKTELGHGLCSALHTLKLKFRLMFHHVSIIIVKLFSPHGSYHVVFQGLDIRQIKNMLSRHTLHYMHHMTAH